MKVKITLALLLQFLFIGASAQTMFWQDDFTNAATPDVAAGSTRTPETNGGTAAPSLSYFKRTDGSAGDIQLFAMPYSGQSGTFFWAGEDHDGWAGAGNDEQQIEWTNINISGRTALEFRGLLGANSSNAAWDNFNTGSGAAGFGIFGPPSNDYMIIEYAIDAGAYTQLYSFFGNNTPGPSPGKSLLEDTNGDFIGNGTTLTQALTQFIKTIPGTGTTLKLKIRVYSNGGNEEWAIDNFRMFAAVLPVNMTDYHLNVSSEGVNVDWATASEENSDYFAIERSLDGSAFTEIGRVAAAGNSTANLQYSYLDNAPETGESFYRIRQVDFNGSFIYTDPLQAKIEYPKEFVLYPNPANETMKVTLASGTSDVKIFNYAGEEVQALVQIMDGVATLDVSSLPVGIYFAKIEQDGTPVMKRFSIRR